MRGVVVTKVLIGVVAAGSLALGTGPALAATTESKAPEAAMGSAIAAPTTAVKASGGKEVAADRTVRGEVTAVEATAKTMTVKTMRNQKEDIIGIEVPDAVKITQGKAAKTLADLKIGDHVWVKYDRMSNGLVADEIHILSAQKMAAKKKSS